MPETLLHSRVFIKEIGCYAFGVMLPFDLQRWLLKLKTNKS